MNPAKSFWRWSALGLLCSFAPQALAQSAGAITQFSYAGVTPGLTKKSVGVHLDGDHNRDVATIVGGRVWFQFAPDLMDLYLTWDSPYVVNDICELEGDSIAEFGAVAVATAGGVQIYGMNPTTHQLGVLMTYHSATPVLAIQPYSATHVQNPPYSLAILTDSGTRVRLLNVGSMITETSSFTPKDSSGSSFTALDFRILNWNGDSVKDFAFSRSHGIVVCNSSGSALNTLSASSGLTYNVALAVVDRSGRSTECVAWNCYNASSGMVELRVDGRSNSGALETDQYIPFYGIDAFDFSTGDFDLDGLRDLVISHRSTPDQVLLLNTSDETWAGGHVFHTSMIFFFSLAAPGTNFSLHHASPAIADFDNDGDPDIFAPCDVSSARFLVRGVAVDEEHFEVSISQPGAGDYDFLRTMLRIDLPSTLSPATATHIQVIAYRATYPGSPDITGFQNYSPSREGTPILNLSFPLTAIPTYSDSASGSGYSHGYSYPTSNPTTSLSWTTTGNHYLYIDSPWESDEMLNYSFPVGTGALYAGTPNPSYDYGGPAQLPSKWFAVDWLIRLYQVDAQGEVMRVYPTRVYTFTNDTNYASEIAMGSLSTNGQLGSDTLRDIGTGTSGTQSGTGGTGSTRPVDPYQPPPPIPPPSGP